MKAVAASVLVGLLIAGCLGPRTDGPLQPTAGITVGLPLQGTAVTWAMPLDPIDKPYVLVRVELVDASGFEIIAVKACEGSPKVGDDYNNCGPVGATWPPADVTLRDIQGTTVGTAPTEGAAILVGVKLAAGSSAGRIDRMRVYYAYEGIEYMVEEPWALEMPPT